MSVYEIMSSSLSSVYYFFEKATSELISDTNQKIVLAAGIIFSRYLAYKSHHQLSREIKKISEENNKFSNNHEGRFTELKEQLSKIEYQLMGVKSFPKIEERRAKIQDCLMNIYKDRQAVDVIINMWQEKFLKWEKTDRDNLLQSNEARKQNKVNFHEACSESYITEALHNEAEFYIHSSKDCSFLNFLDDCVDKNPNDLQCLLEYWKYLQFLLDRPDTTKIYRYSVQLALATTFIDFYPEA